MLFYKLGWKTNDVSTLLYTSKVWNMTSAVLENLVGLSVCKFMCMRAFLLLRLNPLANLAKCCPLDTAVDIADTLSSYTFFENRQLSRGRKNI